MTSKSVGSYDAKTHLPELLREVADEGREIVITKHGKAIARIVPAGAMPSRGDVRATIDAMRKFRRSNTLDGLSIRDLIQEGRR